MKIKRLHLLAPLLALTLCMTVCSSDHGEETPSQAVAPAAPSGLVLFESAETSLTLQWDRVDGADTYAWTLLEGGTQVRGGETAARNVKISDLNPGTAYVFGLRPRQKAVWRYPQRGMQALLRRTIPSMRSSRFPRVRKTV